MLVEHGAGAASVACWIAGPERGRRHGTAAMAAVTSVARTLPGVTDLWATVLPENRASAAMVRRAGFARPPGHPADRGLDLYHRAVR